MKKKQPKKKIKNKKKNNLWIQGELEILEIVLIEILLINKLIKFLKLEDNSLMEYLGLGQVKEGTQIFKESQVRVFKK